MTDSAGSTPTPHPLRPPTASPGGAAPGGGAPGAVSPGRGAPGAGAHQGTAEAAGPAWPSYTGSAQLVGASAGVTVYVDPSLGQPALKNAQDLVADADRVVQANNTIFNIAGGPVDVILFALGSQTDGTGGADHGGCTFSGGNAIEVDVSFGDSARVSALFEAELSECAMNGQLCGYSTGEALSRWCATVVSDNALKDFATAPTWAGAGAPNWVDKTDPTDQSADSTGCGMAFLSWLLSRDHSLAQVAQAMVALSDGGTLAELYAKLTGGSAGSAWSNFTAAVNGLAGGVTTDDPFGALAKIGTSPTSAG